MLTQVTLPLEAMCDLFYSADHHCVVASITCWQRWGGDHAQPMLFTWSPLCSCWQDHELHLVTEVTHLQITHSLCCSLITSVLLITTVVLLTGPWAAHADGGYPPAGDHAQPVLLFTWSQLCSCWQDHELHLLTEVTHLQEIMHSLCLQASEPQSLPASSEQVIADLKGMDPSTLNLHVRQVSSAVLYVYTVFL